jgi:hypothetical protein
MCLALAVTEVDDRSVYRYEPEHDVIFQCLGPGILIVFLYCGTISLVRTGDDGQVW